MVFDFMLVFIDDSGDAGFKIEKGSSRFFVIALVIFDDELEAQKTAVTIKELKRELKFPDDVEFKFCKSSHDVRRKFLSAVCKYNFKIRTKHEIIKQISIFQANIFR